MRILTRENLKDHETDFFPICIQNSRYILQILSTPWSFLYSDISLFYDDHSKSDLLVTLLVHGFICELYTQLVEGDESIAVV